MNSFLQKLIGTWESTKALGAFPTIKDFNYGELLKFEQNGQPLLHYSSITKMGEMTMHCENGFLRMLKPQSNGVTSLEAHNFGITVIYEGTIDGNVLTLNSTGIQRISTAKEPHVTALRKVIKFLSENELEMEVDMATSKTPLTNHLKISYKKKNA